LDSFRSSFMHSGQLDLFLLPDTHKRYAAQISK